MSANLVELVVMTPSEFKQNVHRTYRQAMAASNVWMSFSDGTDRLFRDVSVYGSDAGRDFVETNIEEIRSHILKLAQAKQQQISFRPYGSGNAALAGMREALAELTDMEADLTGKTITVFWARNVIDLV